MPNWKRLLMDAMVGAFAAAAVTAIWSRTGKKPDAETEQEAKQEAKRKVDGIIQEVDEELYIENLASAERRWSPTQMWNRAVSAARSAGRRWGKEKSSFDPDADV